MSSPCAGVTLMAKVIGPHYMTYISTISDAPLFWPLDDIVDGRDDSACLTKCSHMNIDDSNIPKEWCDLTSSCVYPSKLTNPLDCSRVYFGFKASNQVGGEDVIDFTKDWTVITPITNPPDDCTVLLAYFNPITGTDTKYCFC